MESNILWLPTGSESSLDKPDMESQCFNDELVSSTVVRVFLRICVWREVCQQQKLKKPNDASMNTLPTHKPPDKTGRLD